MPAFSYTAVDREGHASADRIVADSEGDARRQLRERGLIVRSLDDDSIKGFRDRFVGALFGGLGRTRSADIASFYSTLAIQLDAGIDIRRAVETLAEQNRVTAPTFAAILVAMRDRVAGGDSLAEAAKAHESTFGRADVEAIGAAERAGVLDEALLQLARRREAAVRLRKSATTALAYPAIVLCIAAVIVVLLFTFVVPTIVNTDLGGGPRSMPLPTLIVASISNALLYFWWLLILLAIAAFFGGRALLRTPAGKRGFDQFVLHVPIIGGMLRKHGLAQGATLLGTSVRCGLNFIEGLDLTARAARNSVLADGFDRWKDRVAAGEGVDEALVSARGFPALMVEMVRVGAETGEMDATLAKLADTYEHDVDETARRLGALVEPALVIFLGGVVLLIALAILLPILQLYQI